MQTELRTLHALNRVPPREYLLLPLGVMETVKGEFLVTHESLRSVIEKYHEHSGRVDRGLMIDYEHNALAPNKTVDGTAAAAGWAKLALKADGIWLSDINWSEKASAFLRNGEYRFLSPAFLTKEDSNEVEELINVALTNLPATHNMEPLVAASRVANRSSRGEPMHHNPHPLSKHLRAHMARHKLTPAHVAASTGIHESRVHHLLEGNPPTQEEMTACMGMTTSAPEPGSMGAAEPKTTVSDPFKTGDGYTGQTGDGGPHGLSEIVKDPFKTGDGYEGEHSESPAPMSINGVPSENMKVPFEADSPDAGAEDDDVEEGEDGEPGYADMMGLLEQTPHTSKDEEEEGAHSGDNTPPTGLRRTKMEPTHKKLAAALAQDRRATTTLLKRALDGQAADRKLIHELARRNEEQEREKVIELGRKEGKLVPSLIEHYSSRPVSELRAFLKVAPVLFRPGGVESTDGGGYQPPVQTKSGVTLSREEFEVLKLTSNGRGDKEFALHRDRLGEYAMAGHPSPQLSEEVYKSYIGEIPAKTTLSRSFTPYLSGAQTTEA